MLTEDYILRMIRDMGRMLAHILGRETENPYAPQQVQLVKFEDDSPALLERLKELADLGNVNRAEDQLFEELDFSDPKDYSTALEFYQYLNGFSDARLRLCDYSREEIFEGLRDCALKFGVDRTLLDAFQGKPDGKE